MALKLNIKSASKNASTATPPEEASRLATQYRDLSKKLDTLEASAKLVRAELLTVVNEYRNERLARGQSDTSIPVQTTDGNKVLVIYPEKYKALGDDNIPALQEAYGDKYALYVEEVETITLREDVSLAQLKSVCGKNFDAVMAFIDVKRTVKPRKGAFVHVADLYKDGKVAAAEDLLTFVDATIGSPSVRT